MTIFHHPKEQWTTLLQQRSWSDLCGIDFVHIMERGSLERVKIFIKSLAGKGEELERHIPSLSACVNSDIFNNGKWNSVKICKLLNFLLEHNRKCATFDGQRQPYAPLIEAVVRHSDYKTGVYSHHELLALAVVRDSDLLENVLQRMTPNERVDVVKQLFSAHKRFINLFAPKLFFTRTVVNVLPEFPDLVVKHMCDNLRWNVAIDLSISQRLKLTANNVMNRMIMGHSILSNEEAMTFHLNKIAQFNQFVELHSEALSPQHWTDILRLFKKVAKKYDVSHVEFLGSHALRDTLQKQVVEPCKISSSAPPKRKM